MLEPHTREIDTIDTAAMTRAREKIKKYNCEETKQMCRLETASNEITGGPQLVCGRPTLALRSALVPQTLSCSVAWKIPNSYMHYLRNIEIRIKTIIKQTLGLTEIATLKFRSKRNPPVKPR